MEQRIDHHLILIGTAHVSKRSIDEVVNGIRQYRPDIIAVELDAIRYQALTQRRRWEEMPITALLKGRTAYMMLAQTFMAMIQRKLGMDQGVEPGTEMLAAIREGRRLGIRVCLVDRDIRITLKRAWRLMGRREKWRIAWNFMKAMVGYGEDIEDDGEPFDVESLMKDDVITMLMEELRKFAPSVSKVLIDERDAYIAQLIRDCSFEPRSVPSMYEVQQSDNIGENPEQKDKKPSSTPQASSSTESEHASSPQEARGVKSPEGIARPKPKRKHRVKYSSDSKRRYRVLGVVGAGHLKGIASHLKNDGPEVDIDIKALEQIPKKRLQIGKAIAYSIPVIFFALIAWALLQGNWERAANVFFWWFIINGALSALGAAVVRAHPYSIATAFIAAPFTSLNPAVAAGWFAGIVEAKVRTPTMKDFNQLRELESMKDFINNRLVRVLLVAALANVGSMIGTFVALPYIVQLGLA